MRLLSSARSRTALRIASLAASSLVLAACGNSSPKQAGSEAARTGGPGDESTLRQAQFPGRPQPHGTPATPLTVGVIPPFSESVLRVTGGWTVSDRLTRTSVYVGSLPELDNSASQDGRVVVAREDFRRATQGLKQFDLPRSGGLKIVSPPLGDRVETSAQSTVLLITSKRRGQFHLNLASNTLRPAK